MTIISGLLTVFILSMIVASIVAAFESPKVLAIQPIKQPMTDDQILDWVVKEGQPSLVQGLKELDEEMNYDREMFV